MKKRLLSIMAALLLTISVIAPVSAAGGAVSAQACLNALEVGCAVPSAAYGQFAGCFAGLSRDSLQSCFAGLGCPSGLPAWLTSGGSGAAKTPAGTAEPAQQADPAPASSGGTTSVLAAEREVAALVNKQRAANGLAPLTLSEELCSGARMKSQDMRDKGYFDHTSPTYGDPFDMMTSLGISYSTAGENIAMGYTTAEAVVNAWMNSPGHRANILSGDFTSIGVGYVADGNYWTQWFIG